MRFLLLLHDKGHRDNASQPRIFWSMTHKQLSYFGVTTLLLGMQFLLCQFFGWKDSKTCLRGKQPHSARDCFLRRCQNFTARRHLEDSDLRFHFLMYCANWNVASKLFIGFFTFMILSSWTQHVYNNLTWNISAFVLAIVFLKSDLLFIYIKIAAVETSKRVRLVKTNLFSCAYNLSEVSAN